MSKTTDEFNLNPIEISQDLDTPLQIRHAYEEAIRLNVLAIVAHSEETRRLLRVAEAKVLNLQNALGMRNQEIDLIKKQLANIQQQLYS